MIDAWSPDQFAPINSDVKKTFQDWCDASLNLATSHVYCFQSIEQSWKLEFLYLNIPRISDIDFHGFSTINLTKKRHKKRRKKSWKFIYKQSSVRLPSIWRIFLTNPEYRNMILSNQIWMMYGYQLTEFSHVYQLTWSLTIQLWRGALWKWNLPNYDHRFAWSFTKVVLSCHDWFQSGICSLHFGIGLAASGLP